MSEESDNHDGDEELSREEIDQMHRERWEQRSGLPPMGEYYALLDIADPDELDVLFRGIQEGPPDIQEEILNTAASFLVEAGDTPMFTDHDEWEEHLMDHVAKGVRVEYMRARLLGEEWEPIFTLWDYLKKDHFHESTETGVLKHFARKKMARVLELADNFIEHTEHCDETKNIEPLGAEEAEEVDGAPSVEQFRCERCGAFIEKEAAMDMSPGIRFRLKELDPDLQDEE